MNFNYRYFPTSTDRELGLHDLMRWKMVTSHELLPSVVTKTFTSIFWASRQEQILRGWDPGASKIISKTGVKMD